jgi:hypothetical protein
MAWNRDIFTFFSESIHENDILFLKVDLGHIFSHPFCFIVRNPIIRAYAVCVIESVFKQITD